MQSDPVLQAIDAELEVISARCVALARARAALLGVQVVPAVQEAQEVQKPQDVPALSPSASAAGDAAGTPRTVRVQERPQGKRCKGPCGELRPFSDFGAHAKAADGRQPRCRACLSAAAKAMQDRRRAAKGAPPAPAPPDPDKRARAAKLEERALAARLARGTPAPPPVAGRGDPGAFPAAPPEEPDEVVAEV